MHYLDYAATAPILPQVREAMLPFLEDRWGNPSSIYAVGREARKGIDEAREKLALSIGASPEEIVFTGGGTEADNLAVKGTAWANESRGRHILLPKIEHHAVLDSAEWLGDRGFDIEFFPVDFAGMVDADAVADRIPVDVKELGVDLAAFSAHKIGGPKGTGALYVRRGVKLVAHTHGGGQERGRRSGTENPAGVVGFGAAAEVVTTELETQPSRWSDLRARLWRSVQDR